MKRREAREALFVLLYEMSFNAPEELSDVIEHEKENRDLDDPYIIDTIHGIYEKYNEIDEKIEKNARGWKLDRLSRVSHAILRISVYEMLYGQIPYSVSINEAVDLAKKFDHSDAPAFINGILNSVAGEAGLKQ